ncbi:MAG: ATP-binding cassette domain-containing protein, partial [Lawsonibacter sp.]
MSDTRKNILEIKDLAVCYDTENGTVCAANGISLELKEKEALGLVGETGAGKTTTALAILRMVPDPPGKVIGGEIRIDGMDVMSMTE